MVERLATNSPPTVDDLGGRSLAGLVGGAFWEWRAVVESNWAHQRVVVAGVEVVDDGVAPSTRPGSMWRFDGGVPADEGRSGQGEVAAGRTYGRRGFDPSPSPAPGDLSVESV